MELVGPFLKTEWLDSCGDETTPNGPVCQLPCHIYLEKNLNKSPLFHSQEKYRDRSSGKTFVFSTMTQLVCSRITSGGRGRKEAIPKLVRVLLASR